MPVDTHQPVDGSCAYETILISIDDGLGSPSISWASRSARLFRCPDLLKNSTKGTSSSWPFVFILALSVSVSVGQ